MLTIKDGEFKMDGKSFRIYSGSMHYFRIMPEYWEDRLRKLKAAGFNTVETYVCWNMHEPRKGEFDFTGRFDIRRFIKTAQEVGLYAIVRPGPYICAECRHGCSRTETCVCAAPIPNICSMFRTSITGCLRRSAIFSRARAAT